MYNEQENKVDGDIIGDIEESNNNSVEFQNKERKEIYMRIRSGLGPKRSISFDRRYNYTIAILLT